MMGYKLQDLIKEYGKPVLQFKPKGNFTRNEIMNFSMPIECIVFNLPEYRKDEYIVYGRYYHNEWHVNEGERMVIRELLHRINYINKITAKIIKKC